MNLIAVYCIINLDKLKELITLGNLRNKVRFSTTLDKDINVKLKAYSDMTGIPISKIIAFALKEYLDKVAKK